VSGATHTSFERLADGNYLLTAVVSENKIKQNINKLRKKYIKIKIKKIKNNKIRLELNI